MRAKKKTSVCLSAATLRLLNREAKRHRRSKSQMLEMWLEQMARAAEAAPDGSDREPVRAAF